MRIGRRTTPAVPAPRWSPTLVRAVPAALLALVGSGAWTAGSQARARLVPATARSLEAGPRMPEAGPQMPEVRPQSPQARPQAPERALVLEREAYTYPAGGRRNPFLPVTTASRPTGVEGVTLLGIIHHPDPAYRIAVIGFRDGSGDPAGGEGAGAASAVSRLRVGEELAGTRIVAIEVDHVVVETEAPGGTVPSVLSMPRAVRGGTGS